TLKQDGNFIAEALDMPVQQDFLNTNFHLLNHYTKKQHFTFYHLVTHDGGSERIPGLPHKIKKKADNQVTCPQK
ncbi:MAG TPA: hypothetical protein PKV73_15935, partial [Agriterribacter sp.]|nr:hypothetical protein [Agriterribacter sp.]